MTGRMQNELMRLDQSESRVEPKGTIGLQTSMGISEDGVTDFTLPKDGLLEFILSPANLNAAYKKVKGNKGSGGIDGMSTEELLPYLKEHGSELVASLREGTYKPNPVRRVEIPKSNGKKRGLGIPTVVDRVVQQAISQVLELLYEPQFSETSYGFRPHRGAHKALLKCGEYIEQGYVFAVDMDLEKFFDMVSHSKLIEVLSHTITDGRVISLIHRYLNAGVIHCGNYEPSQLGVPQGGPLSPILSNIILNELDKELERRGHKFVRYADDLVIFCKSRKAAKRTYEHIVPFIEKKLFLKVNKVKTKVAFNLTKRQLVCFGLGGLIGIPAYIFTRGSLGNETSALLMIGLMMPCFLFAMFEKDGLPFEKVLRNIIRTRFLLPKVRPYKTDNFYAFLSRKEEHPIADQRKDSKAGRRKKAS